MKELKGNLLRFVMHTFTSTCGDGIRAMIDEAAETGKGTGYAYCRIRKKMSTQEFVNYRLTVTLEQVEE